MGVRGCEQPARVGTVPMAQRAPSEEAYVRRRLIMLVAAPILGMAARAAAKQLRRRGQTTWADRLDRGSTMLGRTRRRGR